MVELFTAGLIYLGFYFIFNTGQITTGSSVSRGNQYIQLDKVLYSKVPTISKPLPTFLHNVQGLNHQPQKWETSVLLLFLPLPDG